MPVFQVELLAFGKPGEIREVEISEEEANADTVDKLEAIFKFGQNEFQPRRHPSVSVGDVIVWMVRNFLFAAWAFVNFPMLNISVLSHWIDETDILMAW